MVGTFIAIVYLIVFFGSAFLINRAQYRGYKQIADGIVSHYTTLALFIKQDIRADVFTLGTRNGYFNRFKRCDIYFMEYSIIIVGYTLLWGKKIYAKPLILAQNDPAIKKVNPDSFNHEVYIDFEYNTKKFHNIEIHLKGLTDDERSRFTMLNNNQQLK